MRLAPPCSFPDWDLAPAKFLFERMDRAPGEADSIVTAFRDGEVTLRENRRTEGFTNAVAEIGYQGIREGDLVIHSMDGFAGAIGVSDSDGKASPAVHAYVGHGGVDPRFYAYLLRVYAWSGYITSLAKGVRQRSTAFDRPTFASLELPAPPPDVQARIANFLDAETARIDALIAKKRQLLQLLDERWRSLVDRVTSQGVPIRVRRLTSLVTSGPRGWADRVGDSGDPFIRSANLRRDAIELRKDDLARVQAPDGSEAERSRLWGGDIVIGITGANTGWVGLVPHELSGGFVSQHVAILRPYGVAASWLAYSLFSPRIQDDLLARQYGGTKQQLGLQDLPELLVYVPPESEQEALAAMLSKEDSRMNQITSRMTRQIDLLTERRQAIITAAVTGELDIAHETAKVAS